MPIEWISIKEQIGEPVASYMLLDLHAGSKHNPFDIDSAQASLAAQILLHAVAGIFQPEHASRDGPQQSHPHVKNRPSNLPMTVEAAKDESFVGQAGLCPRWLAAAERPLGIRHVITVRQTNNTFGVITFVTIRQGDPVADHIIDEIR